MVKSVSESNCKPFRKSAIWEKFKLKPKTQIKTHSNNRANYNRQNNEVQKNFQPVRFIYVWTIFEHQVKAKYASQKLQLVPCTRGPQTHFRNAQDHQLAGALTVVIRSIQNTNVTRYEVESQKTVNTKSRKRTGWISELIDQMFDYTFGINTFGRIRLENEKKWKQCCNAMLKFINRYYKPYSLKAEAYFNNSPDYISKVYRKTWCRQKWNRFERLLKFSVQRDTKSTEKSIFRKTHKSQSIWHQISFAMANVSGTQNYEETLT